MKLREAAAEAEADRLFAVFIRIRLLAQTRKIEFALAGEEAVRSGLVSEAVGRSSAKSSPRCLATSMAHPSQWIRRGIAGSSTCICAVPAGTELRCR